MGAIRLFLAFAVLQSHIRTFMLVPNQIYTNNALALGVNGGYAVMFFFVISGFLMSFVLEEKYNRLGGKGDFYRARATRIYPLWWAVWIIAAAAFGFRIHLNVLDFLTSFFLYWLGFHDQFLDISCVAR